MEAWLSWLVFLAIGGSLYWYYSQNNNRARARGRTTQRTSHTSTTKGEPIQWSDSESTPKANAKSTKAKAPRKSVKKTVQEVTEKAEAYLSTASSTAGADADDDLSPAVSPALGATTTAKAPSGRDVSDMLEPKGAAPAVLKIGASEKPERENKPQQKRQETPQETKKQRQNRKKVEEAKAQREADEKQRQILLEKQRRTAREARGEPARNGLQPAQAPNSNAWTTVRSSGASKAPATSGQLLDTFEPDVVSTTSSSEVATNGTAPTPDSLSNSANWTNLPTEEEQVRMAMEDSAWTEVSKSKKQRKTKVAAGGDTTETGSESGVPQEPTPAPVKQVQPKKTEAVQPRSRYDILTEPTNNVGHPMDSDWPVV